MATHITITPITDPITVEAGGLTLGRSLRALELREGSYPPTIYVPRDDIDMSLLEKTNRASTCPWKGQASYYSIKTPDSALTDAVWSYESPNPDVADIAGHLAFYPDRVRVTRG